GKSNARAQTYLSAHNAVSAIKMMFFGKKVHRAAFAFAASGFFSIQLCHSFVAGTSFGNGKSVVAVSGYPRMFRTSNTQHAGSDRLLPNIQLPKASDLLLTV